MVSATWSDEITGIPNSVPPVMFMSGKDSCPNGLTIDANDTATFDDITKTPVVGGLFAAVNLAHSERRSRRTLSASVPADEAMAGAPLVMEAGEIPATAVLAG